MFMVHWKDFDGVWYETEFDNIRTAESFAKTVISPFYDDWYVDDWYVDDEAGGIVYV